MSDGRISTSREGRVYLIGIDRPARRNSLTPEMMVSLGEALTAFDDEEESWVAVLYGEGEHFSAGLDLQAFAPVLSGASVPLVEARIDALQLRAAVRKPIVGVARGITYTVGIELLLGADIIIAADDTRFAHLETKRGIMVSGGGTVRWPQRVGTGNALYHLLRGDEFGAHEAFRIGLVQEVVSADSVMNRAVAIATEIASNAPLAVAATKASVFASLREGEATAFATLGGSQRHLAATADAREGLASFVERRDPRFAGT